MSRILVVDASVVVDLLARFRPQPLEELLWAPGTVLAAPELLQVEVLQALRKLEIARTIPAGRSAELVQWMRALRIRLYRHDSLLDGIWALRRNLTAYDASYVVLARLLGGSVITRDTRLARAPRLGVPVLAP